jgi:hypothetical protein
MKNRARITFLILVVLMTATTPAFPYGYGTAGEDPLISMLKEIIVEAKKKEPSWETLKEIIDDSKEPIVNLDKFFKTKLNDKFQAALKGKDIKGVISSTVNLIYLSMMEKFELIKRQEFKDYAFAKGRLNLNDKFYRDVFRANVKKYDEKNGTNINDTILKALTDIKGTIGKPGKFGMKGEPPHPDDFDRMFKNIRDNLKTVFPDFEG